MRTRTLISFLLVGIAALVAGVLATSTGATPRGGTLLTIRHAAVGCHTWTLNGSTATAHLLILRQGQSFTVENRDNCSHTLTQTSGPTLARAANLSGETGTEVVAFARGVEVTPTEPGVYTFTTAENEAHTYGWQSELYGRITRMQSTGTDNVLKLTVRVWPHTSHVAG